MRKGQIDSTWKINTDTFCDWNGCINRGFYIFKYSKLCDPSGDDDLKWNKLTLKQKMKSLNCITGQSWLTINQAELIIFFL